MNRSTQFSTHSPPVVLKLDVLSRGEHRIFRFDPHAAPQRTVVVGRSAGADIRVEEPAVRGIHFHFERIFDSIWLMPSHGATVRINAAHVSKPFHIESRALIEFFDERLEVHVHQEGSSEAAPLVTGNLGVARERPEFGRQNPPVAVRPSPKFLKTLELDLKSAPPMNEQFTQNGTQVMRPLHQELELPYVEEQQPTTARFQIAKASEPERFGSHPGHSQPAPLPAQATLEIHRTLLSAPMLSTQSVHAPAWSTPAEEPRPAPQVPLVEPGRVPHETTQLDLTAWSPLGLQEAWFSTDDTKETIATAPRPPRVLVWVGQAARARPFAVALGALAGAALLLLALLGMARACSAQGGEQFHGRDQAEALGKARAEQ